MMRPLRAALHPYPMRWAGDIAVLHMDGSEPWTIQSGGYMASSPGVNVGLRCQNLKQGMFSGEGFFVTKVSGRGSLFLCSFGSIHTLELRPGEEMTIDNGCAMKQRLGILLWALHSFFVLRAPCPNVAHTHAHARAHTHTHSRLLAHSAFVVGLICRTMGVGPRSLCIC